MADVACQSSLESSSSLDAIVPPESRHTSHSNHLLGEEWKDLFGRQPVRIPLKGSVLFGQVHCCCKHDDGYIGATLSACVFLRSVLHRVLDDPTLIGRYNNSKTKIY